MILLKTFYLFDFTNYKREKNVQIVDGKKKSHASFPTRLFTTESVVNCLDVLFHH